MKNTILIVLILIGLYWLVDHAAPLPFNHESLGLYNHNIHRVIGLLFFAVAGFFAWKWKSNNGKTTV